MGHAKRNTVVTTIKDKCKVCYTCVRECPVKAIKIIDGQAEVLGERCIGCGNCVNVCSQGAKVALELKQEVETLLKDKNKKVVALLAPSFPAEFTEVEDYRVLVGMIQKLGFDKVFDVAFGADLVAVEYKKLLEKNKDKTYISSDCPAVVFYVEHYHPGLVDKLAPVASPMVASARLARHLHGDDVKLVFIGPCIAKKAESDEIDEGLTFVELRELFDKYEITPEQTEPSDFNGPASGMGALFPISRGLLQNVNKSDNVVEGNMIVDSGKNNFKEAIEEIEKGEIINYNLELLCCDGCIMGPGMTHRNNYYFKWAQIGKHVKKKVQNINREKWENDLEKYSEIDLKQSFNVMDRRDKRPDQEDIEEVLKEMGKYDESDHLNCGACGYETCYDHAVAVKQGYAEDKMCLPFTIEKLRQFIEQLNLANETLKNTKLELKHSEKLANMGQLSAGIAHELNNPLGVITIYSSIILDELDENDPRRRDVELIVKQADRCKNIVGGLLNFARKNQVQLQKVNIVEFLQNSLESLVIPKNIKTSVHSELERPWAMIDTEQMLQVFTNLEKNAIEAMHNGGELNIYVNGNEKNVEVRVSDTGCGIAEKHMEKMFTPFFTTKKIGKGTGLGLPLVYGIIKMHNGKIKIESNADPEKGPTGTDFIITLPRKI
jgi:iron only hydrogenase large subunit-like protein/nitrogen-specific signal transduction histidine kinase